jgi:glycosyltransferase involved in cell wall biosynthesis
MDEVLAGLDIVALTSNNEGTPVSLIEAQAAGKPVISTRVGGVSDVVVDSKSGIIVEPGHAEKFAAGLLKLIECPQLRQSYSDYGRRHVEVKYSYQRLVSDMSDYYTRLIDEAKK